MDVATRTGYQPGQPVRIIRGVLFIFNPVQRPLRLNPGVDGYCGWGGAGGRGTSYHAGSGGGSNESLHWVLQITQVQEGEVLLP